MSEKLQKAYEIYEKLKTKFGGSLRLEISLYNGRESIEVRAYDVPNLVQFKKMLTGCSKLTKNNCCDFQYAEGEIDGIKIYAFSVNGTTFNNNCHIITERFPVEVPACEAHTEYITVYKTVCGKDAQ